MRIATAFSFLAASLWFLTTSNRAVPEHRASMVNHAVVCLVAGLSYLFIQEFYRHYLDRTVTTPPLLLADLWIIATGFIGHNQITATGEILSGPRLLWGAVSTLGYLVIVYILFTQFRRYQRAANYEKRHPSQANPLLREEHPEVA